MLPRDDKKALQELSLLALLVTKNGNKNVQILALRDDKKALHPGTQFTCFTGKKKKSKH